MTIHGEAAARRQVSQSGDDQPLFARFVKGVREREYPISRGSGLRNCADYGRLWHLSLSISFFSRGRK
jgi:hypothetical protein